jgi:exosortase/archaeosortase family protein
MSTPVTSDAITSSPTPAGDGAHRARFVLSFIAIAAAFFSVYCFPYAEHGLSERWFGAYLSVYARLAGTVLSIFDHQIVVSGPTIVGRFSLEIAKNCDAMEANILLCAAILAFPSRWPHRLAATLAGLAVLIAANILRICSLYYVGIYFPSSFELLHLEVWPLVLIALAAAEFILLTAWLRRNEGTLVRASG